MFWLIPWRYNIVTSTLWALFDYCFFLFLVNVFFFTFWKEFSFLTYYLNYLFFFYVLVGFSESCFFFRRSFKVVFEYGWSFLAPLWFKVMKLNSIYLKSTVSVAHNLSKRPLRVSFITSDVRIRRSANWLALVIITRQNTELAAEPSLTFLVNPVMLQCFSN